MNQDLEQVNKAIESLEKKMCNLNQWLSNLSLDTQQNKMIQQIQTDIQKRKPKNVQNQKIAYPKALKEFEKQKRVQQVKQAVQENESQQKLENNYYVQQIEKKKTQSIIISSDSESYNEIDGSEVVINQEEQQREYERMMELQRTFVGVPRRERKRRRRNQNQDQYKKLSELDIEYEDTKQVIQFKIPRTHSVERQVDVLFGSFSLKFIDEINIQTFGQSLSLFNRCIVTGIPNFFLNQPINLHYLNTQTESTYSRNQIKQNSLHYLRFMRKCFDIQGSKIIVHVSYQIKCFIIVNVKYELHRYKDIYYFEKQDVNWIAVLSCPQAIDEFGVVEELFKVLEIGYMKLGNKLQKK